MRACGRFVCTQCFVYNTVSLNCTYAYAPAFHRAPIDRRKCPVTPPRRWVRGQWKCRRERGREPVGRPGVFVGPYTLRVNTVYFYGRNTLNSSRSRTARVSGHYESEIFSKRITPFVTNRHVTIAVPAASVRSLFLRTFTHVPGAHRVVSNCSGGVT